MILDDREFLPDFENCGFWKKNPNFTGNKFELLKDYPSVLLKDLPEEKLRAGDLVFVYRVPSGHLYLNNMDDKCVYVDAEENIDFKLND